jgi:hypothetical protein
MVHAADAEPAKEKPKSVSFRDSADGWFDVSDFLDTVYGFVPVVMPITEPAVGYGAAGALVFIDRSVPGLRPDILAVGGLGTENGTRGAFGVHLGTWLEGKLRTTVALADMDVNLDFFGLGGDRAPVGGLGYTLSPRGGMAGGHYKIGESPVWLGLRYTAVKTGCRASRPAISTRTSPRSRRPSRWTCGTISSRPSVAGTWICRCRSSARRSAATATSRRRPSPAFTTGR